MNSQLKSCLIGISAWFVLGCLMFLLILFVDKDKQEVQKNHIAALGISMDNNIEYFVDKLIDSLNYALDSAIIAEEDRLYATMSGPILNVHSNCVNQNITISSSPRSNKVFMVNQYYTSHNNISTDELIELFFLINKNITASFHHRPQLASYFDFENNCNFDNPAQYRAVWIHHNGLIWQELHEKERMITVFYSDELNRKYFCKENNIPYKKIEPYDIATTLFN